MSVKLVAPFAAADGSVAAAPDFAVVIAGMGFVKALRNAGVPKVSVRAIPSTYSRVSKRVNSPSTTKGI